MNQELIKFVAQHTKTNPEDLVITKLFGQASARQYFRATSKTTPSFVIMKMPQGFSSPAEEITKISKEAPRELPFLNIQKYLLSLELPVPEILAMDQDKGLLLLEDLGDDSLERLVDKAGMSFGLVYYKKAINLLIDLQSKTQQQPSSHCVAYYRQFDEDLLNWEFNHFLEYGIEDRFKITVDAREKLLFETLTQHISSMITSMPQGFVHRDYQSRNLMFKNYDLFLIDFQDALKGPVIYDLVALLRDSYIHFTPDTRQELLNYYCHHLPETHPYYQKKDCVFFDFHLVALQRKLKDTGRFQYIHTVKNNPAFLKNVPQSLGYVKEALQELQLHTTAPLLCDKNILNELERLLKKHVEELR